jgi:tRNA(Ser,Leu) C12 N-acetylase TAN1
VELVVVEQVQIIHKLMVNLEQPTLVVVVEAEDLVALVQYLAVQAVQES